MKLRAALLGAMLAACAVPANAALYVFQLSGGVDARFELDSNPLIGEFDVYYDAFRINGVTITYGNGTVDAGQQIAFFDEVSGGGVEFAPSAGGVGGPAGTYSPYGIALFTGSKATPQFKLGTFDLTDYWRPEVSYQLVISAAAAQPVPEPATWAMLIAGFGAVGATLRRRRNSAGRHSLLPA